MTYNIDKLLASLMKAKANGYNEVNIFWDSKTKNDFYIEVIKRDEVGFKRASLINNFMD